MGRQSHESAQIVVSSLDLPISPEEFMEQCKEQYDLLFPESKLMPGAKRLIEHLHNNNVPIGLATSSNLENYELKVNKHHKELFTLFPYKTIGSSDPEVKRGKPHPDVFLVAASRFPDKPKPEQCLVFEDAPNGVKAARAAGMQVVLVPDPRIDKSKTVEATLVLKSLEDFKPEVFGLPPFDKYRRLIHYRISESSFALWQRIYVFPKM
ncbi:probable pseudouridine-5'-phosphatase isoform X3 [Achroia grisella]|nr:probable pseudouridine-5'-phosphatase isoform X3 [Achroia grisella]XP_059051814.1 probable pseudouridine-5'-phosphatase isoform X3 [Achroia grisella]XP_059051815.1 probable pseudouridine-5'-phosphatase isoform X3 [Achroia grisella]